MQVNFGTGCLSQSDFKAANRRVYRRLLTALPPAAPRLTSGVLHLPNVRSVAVHRDLDRRVQRGITALLDTGLTAFDVRASEL